MSRILIIVGSGALLVLVLLGVLFCLNQVARADITPVIIPTKPAVPAMVTGATGRPSPDDDGYLHTPTTMDTPSFAPAVTATPFGGMLG